MEAAASSCLSAILSKIGGYLVDLCVPKANYLLRFKNNVEDLKKEAGYLRGTRDRVQNKVERAKRNIEEIDEDVKEWLMEVDNILEEIQRLEDDIKVNKTFLCGRCPNLRWRYKLGKRTVKKTKEMSKLQERGNFESVSHPTTLPGVEEPTDFTSFKPTEDAFSQIMEALKNDKINMVGLYGMGGVGKTTLAKVVGKEAKEKKLFDEVVMVTVTQNPDFKKIQTRIAVLLGLKLEDEEETLRAQRLRLRLKMEKKILIILDDVWMMLDLATIGIPFGDAHKGCTILLTTRLQEVCIGMRCQPRIRLNILSDDDALTLFKKHADICDSPELNAVAKEVVGECGGLPIAIKAVGIALRENFEWNVVSKKLKLSKFPDIETTSADEKKVYPCLRLSYDYLEDEETKFCFLLCSLFPEDYEIDLEELLRYGLGLDLYGDDAESIEDARSLLRFTTNKLKSSCLLLDAKEGFVKMHDLVRDVAIWITREGKHVFMVKAGKRLKEWPKHQGLEQCTAVSLMENDIEVLPNGLVCPKLNILLLEGNGVEVSEEFFEEMKTLKVANLICVHLSLNSLQSLTNLVTLQLIHCELSDISSIKKLAQLEILRLKGSGIVELPKELRELSKLRMLDITDCRNLKRIPANVIPRLSRLEELYIGENSFKAWEVEGTSAEGSNASLSELSELYSLDILCLFIIVQQRLPKDFVLPKKLLRYDIRVNDDDYGEGPSYPKSRLLKIRGIEATSLVAFKALYENVEYLELVGIKRCCQNMVPSIDETGLNELKRLSLESFDELDCIIDTTQQQDVASTAFSNLVDLSLRSCDGLREICSGGRPPRGFIENLETLKISVCHSMSCLFPSWMLIQSLQKLKEVNIEYCGELEDVFQLEGLCYAKENPFLLSSLESLDLKFLRNLRYIWKGPTQQVSLQSLTVVKVVLCHQLRYLFTLSLARSLLQLEQLKVWRCGSLEHIVEIKEAEENVGGGGGNDVMFPKLRILKLDVLENFISFFDSENYSSTWPALQELSLYLPLNSTTSFVAQLEANVLQKLRVLEVGIISDQLCNSVLAQLIHGFQNLEELTIRNCRVQVLSQLELSLPSLKVLKLEYLRELEWLCKGPTHLLSLPNLTKLSVDSCNRLRHMFSPSLARNLLQLEELIIENCGELEQIFNEDDAAECNQTLSKDHLRWPLLFPNLSSIGIWRCDKLKSMFPVSMAHLLSLQNLTTLRLSDCHGLTHLFSSTHARNLLQLESIDIVDCGDLEQIIVEDHTEDDHVLLLPQLKKLTLHNLQSLVNFCPVGYHFIFPSLSKLWMTKCPKLTTRFSVDQNRSVHTETKAPQKGKEDVDMEQSSPETTKEIEWWDFDDLQSQLPPYIGK